MNNFINKRIHSNQVHQPNKFQRIHYTEQMNEDIGLQYYHDQMSQYDSQHDQTLAEYNDSQQTSEPTELEPMENTEGCNYPENQESVEQVDDINFLD